MDRMSTLRIKILGIPFGNEAFVLLVISSKIELKHIFHTMKFNKRYYEILLHALLKGLASMNIKVSKVFI